MKGLRSVLFISFSLLVVLTQFNNCDTYTNGALVYDDSPLLSADDQFNNADHIELQINSGSPVLLDSDNLAVSGDCYAGGFSDNYIEWKLNDHLGATLAQSQSAADRSKCVDGRFYLSVSVPSDFDPFVQHDLQVELVSVSSSGVEYRNSALSRKSIQVVAGSTYIKLALDNPNTVITQASSSSGTSDFNVSGDCHPGNTGTTHRIEWQIPGASGQSGQCSDGRFTTTVTLPQSMATGLYTLYVELISISSSSVEYRNPLMAKKSIEVDVTLGP